MRKEQQDRIDPSKPALIVLYGATRRKCRPLDGEITVLGRNPGCDVGLVSPEVAPIHCVIVRLANGWRIRDCSGRATRVNGKPIQDEPLKNGDVIQIGTFSFEAHLPPSSPSAHGHRPAAAMPAPSEPSVDVEHLQASRRRLAELALGLRRRLQESQQQQRDLAQREQDLHLLEQRLRAATQERQGERAEAQSRLDHRKAELDHFAKHLRRQEQKLREQEQQQAKQIESERLAYEADLMRERAELEQERREVASLRQQVIQRHVEVEHTAAALEEALSREKEQLERDRQHAAQERLYLDEQRQELLRMRAEMERQSSERGRVAPATADDTHLDEPVPDRLASARQLLRRLAERRKALGARPE